MTQKDKLAQISASLFRQIFYAKLLEIEHSTFVKFNVPFSIKNILKRMKDNYSQSIHQLEGQLPKDGSRITQIVAENDEKLRAISIIVERLVLLPEDAVLELEQNFIESVKISYEND